MSALLLDPNVPFDSAAGEAYSNDYVGTLVVFLIPN
jgi:hypothetical protein